LHIFPDITTFLIFAGLQNNYMGIVRKQSLYSSISIYIGFAFGAFNLMVLMPHIFNKEQIGLTRVLIDIATLLATVASLGAVPVINKFFPFYQDYLTPKKNDLPKITIIVSILGYLLFLLFAWIFHDLIVRKFSGNSKMLIDYFYALYPLTLCILVYNMLEGFSWGLHKTIASNFWKEAGLRMISTVILVFFGITQLDFKLYIDLFSVPYALAAIALLIVIWRTGELKIVGGLSSVSRRLGKRMITFSSYVFTSHVFTLLRKMNDVLIITSVKGLAKAGLFSYATFVVNFMEVPQRSMYAITTPILATAWKNKDMAKIAELYTKSSITLSIVGMGIFGAIWLSTNNLVLFLGQGWEEISAVVFILGIARMVDLVTGVNNQIIQTSNYWRFDFICSILLVVLSITLNYFFVQWWDIKGAAYADLITVTIFNIVRYLFIWIRFDIQPFSWKTLWVLLIGTGIMLLVMQLPFIWNIYADTIVRSGLYVLIFGAAVIMTKLSEDVNTMWSNMKAKVIRK